MGKKTVNAVLLVIGVLVLGLSDTYSDWPMPGHDPQRSSWAQEETVGVCTNAVWCNELYEYIPHRTQILTVNGSGGVSDAVYATAADGIYSLDPDTGNEVWKYAMTKPPGDAPTIMNNIMYICGTDKTIHAVDIVTRQKIWQTDRAGAAFYCNPLVVNGNIYAGNRDGYFYCFNTSDGSLVWYYPNSTTPLEPISTGAAYQTYNDYPNGLVFFTTRDGYGYALKADDGSLVWKTSQMTCDNTDGFWPVIYKDTRVIFTTSEVYPIANDRLMYVNKADVINITWAELQVKMDGSGNLDVQHHIDGMIQYPERKTFYVIDRNDGQEAEIAPFLERGNAGGNRYPPAMGPNDYIWCDSPWHGAEGDWFTSGRMAGWLLGSSKMKLMPGLQTGLEACDEPDGWSIIGNDYIYYNGGGDGFDKGGCWNINTGAGGDQWLQGEFSSGFPNEWKQYWPDRKYGGPTGGLEGHHGHQNPPVPMNGKVYFHRSNSVICMGS